MTNPEMHHPISKNRNQIMLTHQILKTSHWHKIQQKWSFHVQRLYIDPFMWQQLHTIENTHRHTVLTKHLLKAQLYCGKEWNGQEGPLIPLYSLKTSNFHSTQNWEELEEMELHLMNLLLKLPKNLYIFSHLF